MVSPNPKALALSRDRLTVSVATLPPERRKRLAEGAAMAVEVLIEQLLIGEPHEQANAARLLLAAETARLSIDGKSGPLAPGVDLPREQRILALRAALRDPDDELTEALSAEWPRWKEMR